ncbi:uncharacterized protein LOC100369837 [Saccoglossus kowalevskii]|uniref:Uncharacterized protein LOC100369837 n=1 Tax=Saccoglossus kowalevskii TaxID=10224 RepID=A0ABM0MQP7_SACKO|nr:PREDICTED: uncharacterized protein LOC100369837 [Saccoglossus kowalevskii]
MNTLRCEDCRVVSASVTCCQGDILLCQSCNGKRFGSDSGDKNTDESLRISNTASGVIINEMLCFIVNKNDILTTGVIVKLCTDYFVDEEVESSKKTLFELCGNDRARYIKRQGPNKRSNNILDVVKLVHETDFEDLPSFVAKDLSKLPPIDITHVDISAVMKEMTALRRDMTELKDQGMFRSASSCEILQDVQNLRQEIDDLKNGLKESRMELNCMTDTANAVPMATDCLPSPSGHKTSKVSCNAEPTLQHSSPSVTYAGIVSSHTSHEMNERKPAHGKFNMKLRDKNSDGFTTVNRKRKNQRGPRVGTADPDRDCAIKVVHYNPPFRAFITRLSPLTSTEDIQSFVKKSLNVQVNCEKLKTKFDTYSSFLIETTREFSGQIMDPTVWPTGILIRKYY